MKSLLLAAWLGLALAASPAVARPDKAKKPLHGQSQREMDGDKLGYGAGGCPPGLKKKNPECMPPGRYKKLFEVGQRVPRDYDGLGGYRSVPPELRRRHSLDPNGRYIYHDDYLYRVDPKTMIVREVLRAVL